MKLAPPELIPGASGECPDFFFSCRIPSVNRNIELAKHSISKGVNSEIEGKEKSAVGVKGRHVSASESHRGYDCIKTARR